MLIDASYFTAGPRQIYNATLGSGTTKENAVIEQYITEYQEDFLWRVLGQKAGESVQEYLHNLDKCFQIFIIFSFLSVSVRFKHSFTGLFKITVGN